MPAKKPWADSRPQGDAGPVVTEPADPVGLALADQIRSCYIMERSAHDAALFGREADYEPPPAYDGHVARVDGELDLAKPRNVWKGLADFFTARAVDPEEYVRVAFRSVKAGHRAPEPDALKGDKFFEAWELALRAEGPEVKTGLYVQNGIAAREIAVLQRFGHMLPAEAHASVLLNTSLELTPLFRYCLATSLVGEWPRQRKRFEKIAAYYENEAAVQFERGRRHYRRHWVKVLPDGFGKKARLIYRTLFGGGEGG